MAGTEFSAHAQILAYFPPAFRMAGTAAVQVSCAAAERLSVSDRFSAPSLPFPAPGRFRPERYRQYQGILIPRTTINYERNPQNPLQGERGT